MQLVEVTILVPDVDASVVERQNVGVLQDMAVFIQHGGSCPVKATGFRRIYGDLHPKIVEAYEEQGISLTLDENGSLIVKRA